MTKRIISSIFAFLLVLSAIMISLVAITNVCELFIEMIVDLLLRQFWEMTAEKLINRVFSWMTEGIPNFGINMKLIVSVTLVFLAGFVVSYKQRYGEL